MISKMKFVSVVGTLQNYDKIVSDYIMDCSIELVNPLTALKNTKGFLPNHDANPYEDVLKRFVEVFEYADIDYKKVKRHKENFSSEELTQYIDVFDQKIHALKGRLEYLESQIAHAKVVEETLSPIMDANVHIDDLIKLEYLKFRFGRMPVTSYAKIDDYLKDFPAYFVELTRDRDYVWGFYVVSQDMSKKVDHIFATMYFERFRLDGDEQGTPAEIVEKVKQKNIEWQKEIDSLRMQIDKTVAAQREDLLRAYSDIKFQYDLHAIKKFAPHTKNTFYITGWMEAREAKKLFKKAEKDPECTVIIDDPSAVRHLTPPTKIRNYKIFKPFEEFVKMYGVPNYNEMDPTVFLAVVYTLLFGIMFGDVGHGACLLLIGIAMIAMKKGGFLAKLLPFIGTSSMIFGFLYGSVFGFESEHALFQPIWYTPFESSDTMMQTLIYSVVLGVVIILVCMVFNIINGIRQKDWQKIWFSQNGVAGMVFYILVLYCALRMLLGSDQPLIFAGILIVISLILIFLQEPLGKLAARKKDWMPKEKGGFLVEAFFELFEIVLSFVTNTVSFLRVGAFALNHAGMMSVVVMFMTTMNLGASIGVAIFGNLLVIGLEGLIVGIQVLRLGFYEMFSRFYSGDGREFKSTNE